MTQSWRDKLLGEVADEITVGHVGPMAERYTASGIPFLRSQNVRRLRLDLTDVKYIPEDFHAELNKSRLQPGDVVVVRTGDPGACAVIPPTLGVANCADLVIVRPGPELDANFTAYYINEVGRHHIHSHLVGAVQQHFNVGAARTLPMKLPSITEQRAVAAVLGALDDKIEQNRRTARALERLARAIFRAWFVDFEPVKAKAAGATSFPSMPQPVFDALPTRFVDSPIGLVPEGWPVKALSECAHLTMGQSPPSEYYNEIGEGLPFHQGVTDYGFRFPTHRVFCTVDSRIAEARDVLLSVRAPVGRINVADHRLVLGRGLAGLRHQSGRQSFLLHQLSHVFAEEDAVGDGTIYKAVTKQFLSQMPMISPGEDAQAAFENIARPLDDLVAASEIESRKLTEMRDYLLPKLLSGTARVVDGGAMEAAP